MNREHLDAAVLRYLETGEMQWVTADGKPDLDKLRANGVAFGYPACCVAAFVRDCSEGRLPGELRGVTAGGWVPCIACAKEVAA